VRRPSRHIRHSIDTEHALQVTPRSFAGQKFGLPLAHLLPVRTMKLRQEHTMEENYHGAKGAFLDDNDGWPARRRGAVICCQRADGQP
jgi:hypothetical protein